MKLKLCDSQLVPSWMQWAKGMPMHTDGSPAEKPYKKTIAKEKRQENVFLSRMCALRRHQTLQGQLQSPHMVPSARSEVSIYGLLEMALVWSPWHGGLLSQDGRLRPGTPRSITKRPQGKEGNHHIPLPSIVVHHEIFHPSWPLGVGLPLLPTEAELVGPVSSPLTFIACPKLPISPLDLPMEFRCLLLNDCAFGAPKAAIYSCCAQPSCLWATSTSPYKDTVWPSALHVGWPHLHVSSSLPQRQRQLHTGAALLLALNVRSHHPVRHRPSSEELQPREEGRDTRKPVALTWWSARDFCGVVNCSLCAFLGPTHFSVRHRTSHSTMLPVLWCRKRWNPFMKPGLCKALYTMSFWPICHYLYNGPYCAFLGLDKVACVRACMYTSAKDTPGRPWAPGMPVAGAPRCSATRGTPLWPASLSTSRSLR